MYLKEIRLAKNLTQQQLADMTGIDRPSIARYESGNRYPPIDKLQLLAKALGVSLDILVGNDSYEKTDDQIFDETLYRRPGMRILFDAAKDAPDDVLQKTADLLEAMKNGRYQK